METDEDVHAELVDFPLAFVHLVVVGDHRVGEFHVALQQRADGAFQIVAGLGGHRQHLVAQGGDGLIEIVEDVGAVHGGVRFKTQDLGV